jgi:hypothetical protein
MPFGDHNVALVSHFTLPPRDNASNAFLQSPATTQVTRKKSFYVSKRSAHLEAVLMERPEAAVIGEKSDVRLLRSRMFALRAPRFSD